MAHYAKLDDTNTVIDVLVVDDAQEAENGVAWIQQWLKDSFGGTKWLKTSYNTIGGKHLAAGTPFRMNYAVIGCLLYTSPSPRDGLLSRMPSSA